jgi:hypothetical protein
VREELTGRDPYSDKGETFGILRYAVRRFRDSGEVLDALGVARYRAGLDFVPSTCAVNGDSGELPDRGEPLCSVEAGV